MNIYLLKRTDKSMYGQYREVVVIAPDPETAAKIHPEYSPESPELLLWEEDKYDFDIETDEWSTEKDWLRNEWFGSDQWVRPDQLQVTLVGIAKTGSEIGVFYQAILEIKLESMEDNDNE